MGVGDSCAFTSTCRSSGVPASENPAVGRSFLGSWHKTGRHMKDTSWPRQNLDFEGTGHWGAVRRARRRPVQHLAGSSLPAYQSLPHHLARLLRTQASPRSPCGQAGVWNGRGAGCSLSPSREPALCSQPGPREHLRVSVTGEGRRRRRAKGRASVPLLGESTRRAGRGGHSLTLTLLSLPLTLSEPVLLNHRSGSRSNPGS